ncbi:toxin-antitoxin system, antitoxin component, ribbon-helix-helix domain protein [Ostertagia ostertagi]
MYSNRLETAVARFKSEKIEALNVAAADGDNLNTFMRESMQRLEEAIGALEEAGGKIRELLQEYAETLSSLENPPEKGNERLRGIHLQGGKVTGHGL